MSVFACAYIQEVWVTTTMSRCGYNVVLVCVCVCVCVNILLYVCVCVCVCVCVGVGCGAVSPCTPPERSCLSGTDGAGVWRCVCGWRALRGLAVGRIERGSFLFAPVSH